jgi:hypothetical protein
MGPARGLKNLRQEATHQSEEPRINCNLLCKWVATHKLLILQNGNPRSYRNRERPAMDSHNRHSIPGRGGRAVQSNA